MDNRDRPILFATLPYSEVLRNIDFLTTNNVGVEVAAHDTNWLLNVFRQPVARKLGEELRERGIAVMAAGPIFDLNPGSLDHIVRKHTENCFLRAVDLAVSLNTNSIVLPSGFNPLIPEESVEGWRELSLETWEVVGRAARRNGIEIVIKNVFDHTPDIILRLVETLDGLPFGICLDTGHVNVYSNMEVRAWLRSFGSHIREIHLHDNLGTADDHLPVGEGIIDYESLFKSLMKLDSLLPMTFDMEVDDMLKSLKFIDRFDLLGLQLNLL